MQIVGFPMRRLNYVNELHHVTLFTKQLKSGFNISAKLYKIISKAINIILPFLSIPVYLVLYGKIYVIAKLLTSKIFPSFADVLFQFLIQYLVFVGNCS